MGTSSVARAFTLVLVILGVCQVHSLESCYYQHSCPSAEQTIAKVVAKAIYQDARVGSGILRLFFHDCFVEGCDASILIDSSSNDAEKDAVPNQSLYSKAFDAIDDAKTAVEDICPETVSCADILAYSASVSVAVLGGQRFDIQGGRLDGFVSKMSEIPANLPAPNDTLSTLKNLFSSKGLNKQDLVVLSGAHTIGKAHCTAFENRLSPNVDPSLNSEFAHSLDAQCVSTDTLVDNDVQTPTSFDNAYHQNVVNGKALFKSDAELYTSSSTSNYVDQYANNNGDFLGDFTTSLMKMGQIDLKSGSKGNIRRNCRSFN